MIKVAIAAALVSASALFQIKSPYAVGELPGGKAPKLAVDFHLIDMERFFHAIMGIGHRCCLPAVAPVVLKSEVSAMLKNILSAARQIWNFLP